MQEYSTEEVAVHKTRDDLWVMIHGKVYDVSKYVRDHPGGADVLIDVAGTDATEAYEEVGHSEDADGILKTYLIGTAKDAHEIVRPKAVRLVQSTTESAKSIKPSSSIATATLAAIPIAGVGDKVLFRGPKGAMRYKRGLCKKIGMIAGGTGITPMYQLIRAICEDDKDTTEVSLILANRTEEDILLRKELEAFATNYPKNFKVWYMLDQPPQKWAYGKGFVTQAVMTSKLPGPSPDTKVMLCGPPGMVNASKKALVAMGFEAPGAVGKMTDQIFCF
ncbi:hypothetical protein TsFJ059_001974 [Trichoderma semiorbis]|uniref:Cytochrome b5 heme-binding domain-containing protein n=1 Tax=Trichoderma semiorbis TaxID=1491008 RepID=A0A9P8I0N1_9HYPO|nr:hypothetical protein TsFJ059_001974 [Trichoderma semiorbis]